jgi:hypothetical protein
VRDDIKLWLEHDIIDKFNGEKNKFFDYLAYFIRSIVYNTIPFYNEIEYDQKN